MQIQLSWGDPVTGEQQEPIFPLPFTFGRDLTQLPSESQSAKMMAGGEARVTGGLVFAYLWQGGIGGF
ncbi:MAG: hypothetical protein ACUVRV_01805 [Cyanobacteriota bacterium]